MFTALLHMRPQTRKRFRPNNNIIDDNNKANVCQALFWAPDGHVISCLIFTRLCEVVTGISVSQRRNLVTKELSSLSRFTHLISSRTSIWTRQRDQAVNLQGLQRMRNNLLLSQWSGSNPLYFAALIVHSQQITFSSCFSEQILRRPCCHQRGASGLLETRRNSPLRQNQWILRTFPWWRHAAVSMNVSHSHWLPVCEYFQPLCSFLSVVGLSLPSLLFDQLRLFLSLSFSFLAKLPSQCGDNFPPAVRTTYFEKDVSLQTIYISFTLLTDSWFPPLRPVLLQRDFFVHVAGEGGDPATPTPEAAVQRKGAGFRAAGGQTGLHKVLGSLAFLGPAQTSEFPTRIIPSFIDSTIAMILVYKQLGE